MKKIITIGPSIERTKGGMASVIQSLLTSDSEKYGYQIIHYVSHVEGSADEKLSFLIKCFFRLLVSTNVALVHIHTACDASFYRKALFVLLCRLKEIPVIMHVHGADFHTFYLKANGITKSFIKSIFKSCDKVIVLSNYWKVFFYEQMGLNNIKVLYNAVNCAAFNASCTIPQNINKFLFLGRLGERKGAYDLVKAIDVLVNKEGLKQLKFYFAGDGEIEEVKAMVNQLALTPYIDILGWINNDMKASVLAKADTVVLPSYNEGLPVALLEAMAAGKIILSTKVGGIPDLVAEGVNGFLIEPGDINALVLNIKHIIQHQDQMEIIAKNNIKKIENDYNSTHIDEQLFRLYDQLAK